MGKTVVFRILKLVLPSLIVGVIVFMELHFHHQVKDWVAGVSSGAIVIAMAILMVFSRSVSCIVSLLVPMLGSKVGKSLFVTIITSMLLTGPIANLHYNFKQTSNSLMCFGEAAFNQTIIASENHRELMQEINSKFSTRLAKFTDKIKSIQNVVESVDGALQITSEGLNSAATALEKEMNRCQDVMSSANGNCQRELNSLKTKCINFFNGAGLSKRRKRDIFSGLLNLGNNIGNTITNGGQSVISEITHVGQNIGNTIINGVKITKICDLFSSKACLFPAEICGTIKKIGSKTLSSLTNIPNSIKPLVGELNVGINNYRKLESMLNNTVDFDEIKSNVTNEVDYFIDQLLTTVQGLTTALSFISLIIVLISTWLYYLRYRNSLVFDNIYINKEVRDYDIKHQEETESPSLFPLKEPKVKKGLVDCQTLALSPNEHRSLITGLILYCVVVFMTVVAFLVDWILYRATDIIQRNGQTTINVTVESDQKFNVEGDGFLSDIFRLFLFEFEHQSSSMKHLDTISCLPKTRPPLAEQLIGTVIVVIIFGFVVVLQPYFLRSRNVIAGCFYPEQKQDRVAFLHSELCRRNGFKAGLSADRIPGVIKENQMLTKLRDRASYSIMIRLGFFRRYCLYCGEKVKHLNVCDRAQDCSALYCTSCWPELKTCVRCKAFSSVTEKKYPTSRLLPIPIEKKPFLKV